jgi:hypothetical protein
MSNRPMSWEELRRMEGVEATAVVPDELRALVKRSRTHNAGPYSSAAR